MRRVDRREFLRTSGLVTLGAVVVACGGDDPTVNGDAPAAGSIDQLLGDRPQGILANVGAGEVLAREGERIHVIAQLAGSQEFARGGSGRIWFAPDRTSPAIGPFDLAFTAEGIGDAQLPGQLPGLYTTRARIPSEGGWLTFVEITPEGEAAPLVGGSQVFVGRQHQMPIPGETAPSPATPTYDNNRDVDPICTRVPICAMHEISLDEALANGRPTVVTIGTPAFCQSRTCGPMIDVVEGVAAEVDEADFVHIELYEDAQDAPAHGRLAPGAIAYEIAIEPVVYFVAPDGLITDRLLGIWATDEVRESTALLLG